MSFHNRHLVDLASVLFLYAGIFASFYGWGHVGLATLNLNARDVKSVFTTTWLGFALVLVVLQAVHLFAPIDWKISIFVYGAGLLLSLSPLLRLIQNRRAKLNFNILFYALLILAFASWIASRSMLPPTNYDSGLYHFNTIRWINSCPIVPGLGNLYYGLALNQSFFVYVASLNFFPYFPHGHNVANSFLFCLVFSQIISELLIQFRQGRSLLNFDPLLYLPPLFILPILIYYAVRWDWLSSPTPDVASILIQLYIFMMFVQMVYSARAGNWDENNAVIATILSVSAVTIKLSNLVFSIAITIVSLYWLFLFSARKVISLSKSIRLLIACGAVLLIWVARGYVLSGFPLFPSTIAGLTFDWAMPQESVRNAANWLYSSARFGSVKGLHPLSRFLTNWDWFWPWGASLFNNEVAWGSEIVLYPAICAIFQITVLCVISLALIHNKRNSARIRDSVLLIPTLIGLIFWFFTLPIPRYANSSFWLLSIGASLVLLSYLYQILSRRFFTLLICLVFLVTNMVMFLTFPAIKFFQRYFGLTLTASRNVIKSTGANLQGIHIRSVNDKDLDRTNDSRMLNDKKILGLSVSGFHSIPSSTLLQKNTFSGLTIYTPAEGYQCWDSPIPSTPHFNPELRLRADGNIKSGFTFKR